MLPKNHTELLKENHRKLPDPWERRGPDGPRRIYQPEMANKRTATRGKNARKSVQRPRFFWYAMTETLLGS